MTGVPMSRAAGGLLRGLLARAAEDRDRFLLIAIRSTDWQSLTFTGERHLLTLRITPPDAPAIAGRFAAGLEDHEFDIPGETVADIKIAAPVMSECDGVIVTIEALTIRD